MSGITDLAADLMGSLGYLGLGLLVALEGVFLPLPSELILPLAGYLCGQGFMALQLAILVATIGSVVSALVLYAFGSRLGEHRVRSFLRRRGRYLLLEERDLDRSQDWFRRHGDLAVLLGRLVPGFRSLISIPAGLHHMRLLRFVVLTAVGSAVWNALLLGFGFLLGDRWQDITGAGHTAELLVLALGGLVLLMLVGRRLRQRRAA